MARALTEALPPMRPHTAAGWITVAMAESFDLAALIYMGPGGPAFMVRLSADTRMASFNSKTKHLAAVVDKIFRSGPMRDRWAALEDVATWRGAIRAFRVGDWPGFDRAMSDLAGRGWGQTLNILRRRVLEIAALGGAMPPDMSGKPKRKARR
ncbi:MAG: hypothetical protein KIT48_12015 [Pseudolabrys sp.]|nr:hypothetical protein [Pseudolabrys sp.]